ncbi:MAG: ImmA/IrrE family metallo-endopeptidase [Actinobacteria bacterium]|nr:ImmA/IrrE family metallo-endopeptidase [Actinomycetota bacterium]
MNGFAAAGFLRQKRTKVQIPWSPSVEVMGMRSKVEKEAERDALRLVKTTFRDSFAVEPVGIAERLGIQVREAKLDEDTLGALFMRPSADPRIVVNRGHSFLRRRLTCAAELGHYVGMSAKTDTYKRVDLRDGFEQEGGEADDAYAVEFAGSLLMPKEDVKILADLQMDDLEMALRFLVPRDAMQIRLAGLGMRALDLEAAS